MIFTFVLLLASAIAIYISCEFFVNGVEWVGQKFNVSQSATGSVLAAFGTALPECVVTFVAVVFGQDTAQKELGVGAAIGGPLVLATVAYAVVGLTFILSKKKAGERLFSGDTLQRLVKDQRWFLWVFVLKVALGLIAFAIKPWLGIVFLLIYALYVRQQMNGEGKSSHDEEPEPLKFLPHDRDPSATWAVIQTSAALVVIFFSSQLFVHQLELVGPWLGMSPQIVALLLSPIATELPEILNAVIWVRQGKQNMALANISGAMMIQATIPSALAIIFTPWMLAPALIWAAAVTLASILGLLFLLYKNKLSSSRMACFGLLYLVFAAGLFIVGI